MGCRPFRDKLPRDRRQAPVQRKPLWVSAVAPVPRRKLVGCRERVVIDETMTLENFPYSSLPRPFGPREPLETTAEIPKVLSLERRVETKGNIIIRDVEGAGSPIQLARCLST